nr:InlB B-repeat-containing protein [Treponema sp.]
MKNSSKTITRLLLALAACAALCFAACSNSSDNTIPTGATGATPTTNGGGTTTTTETPGAPETPATPATYTITFNANDGSESPATATQTFTEGSAQALKTISALGFSKSGYYFAGWGSGPDATQASYADGASYTATSNANLYALWSAIPVYSVNIPAISNGTVAASPATGTAGTAVTLTATPSSGYQLSSISVTAADNSAVALTGSGNTRTFTMPAQNVTVSASFTAINYTITVGSFENGSVAASATTATIGT